MTTMYGKLNSEKLAEENLICRQLVREISLLGITERQKTFIIYLLAQELENHEHAQAITSVVNDVTGKRIFLSGQVEEGELNGSSNT